MVCPKCGSSNVNVQIVNEQKIVKNKHSVLYWVFIGWWFNPIVWFIKWFFFTLPAIIFKLFGIGGKKKQIKNIQKSVCVCQDCGHHWNA